MLLQDIGNDGFHRMIKTELPSKSFNNNEAITHQLNNHEFVSTYLTFKSFNYKLLILI